MRILHVDSGREMRGGQWQVLRLHRGLVRRGVRSMLLAREGAPLLALARQEGLPCDSVRPLRLPLFSRSFDLMHAHDSRSHTIGTMLSRVPLVVSRRVAFPVRDTLGSRWKYQSPVLFIAVSHFVANELRRACVPEARITIVHDGVPIPESPASGRAVLVPHSLDPGKGMALAAQAAELAGVPIVVSRNLEADLPRARALLYLSRSEGLGSGILLAMSYGVTVIASKIGGVPELIEDGENGILVDNTPETIAAAFRRINPALGHAARETVRARFSEARMVQATVERYEQVLD